MKPYTGEGLIRAMVWVYGTVLAWCALVILCGALGLLSGCAAAPVVPAVVVSGCSLKVHPPTQPVLHAAANCTALYAFCLTAEDTRALILWRAEVESWEDDAWSKCERFPASRDP